MTSISKMNGIMVSLLMAIGLICGASTANSAELLPSGLTIETDFKPGPGEPVGNVSVVQGKVVVIHKDKSEGYYAVKSLPLYKGDTLITLEHGRIQLKLNDESKLTLGSATKLVINSSVYAPEAKTRFSLFKMMYGKARFVVQKLTGFDKSDVSVKTKTAILGVRGSDFVVRATDTTTEVTALDNTVLEIRSLAAVEMKPTLLEDYQKVMIQMNAMPSAIEKISENEKMEMLRDLTVMPAVAVRDEKLDVRREEPAKKDTEEQPPAVESPETGEPENIREETAGEAETSADAHDGDIEVADDVTETADDMTDTSGDAADTSFSEGDTSVEAAGIDADIEAVSVDFNGEPDMAGVPTDDVGDVDQGNQGETQSDDANVVDTNDITGTIADITNDAAQTVTSGEMPQLPDPPLKTCP